MGLFKKAVKHEARLRLAIMGPSGSGKTYSALAIATALGGPIAVIDTENGSAKKYSDLFGFDVAEMHAPFHPDKFISAIEQAVYSAYHVLIIDSLSHAWSGTGGVLDLVDEAAKRSKSGNSYTAWKEGTPIHNRLIDAIVQANIDIIVTMRSKTEYVLTTNDKGRQVPQKVGMAPIQRDNTEYEFDVVFDMDIENNAIVSKSRCPALTGRVIAKPGAQVAKTLKDWLHGDTPAPQPKPISHDVDFGDGPRAQKPAASPQQGATTLEGDNGHSDASEGSPPHNRLWGIGLSVFGQNDWDMARGWLIKKWTARNTPDSVRTSTSQLSEDEKTLLGDYINEKASELQKAWPKQKALMVQATEPQKEAA